MRLKFIYPVIILAAALVLVSCNGADMTAKSKPPVNAASPETVNADGAPRISTAELETMMKEGKAFVVDVRSQDSYDMGHIPGARLIPAGEILNHLKELPSDKTIVTYCS